MSYAENTNVPIERSEMEIKTLVRKYGASKVMTSWDDRESIVVFVCKDRLIRFKIAMPSEKDAEKTEGGKKRHIEKARKIWLEKESRRRWRALALAIKAKLEAVDSGIETFEEAFLSHIVTDDKRTVYERIIDNRSSLKLLPAKSDDLL